MSRYDDIRAANPDLRISIYGMTPGGPVTLEVITPDEQTFTWTADTADGACDMAFPPEPTDKEITDAAPSIFD